MPFVNQEHRDKPDNNIPGDRCYVHYRWMMDEWKKERRWTTADKIYAAVMRDDESLEEQRAKELAWQVFFNLHVMKYEEEKRAENGDIQ
jgi:hypothetical protein